MMTAEMCPLCGKGIDACECDEDPWIDMEEDDELLIPESVAVRIFNKHTGANCKTMEETVRYLETHPEARHLLELAGMDESGPKQ